MLVHCKVSPQHNWIRLSNTYQYLVWQASKAHLFQQQLVLNTNFSKVSWAPACLQRQRKSSSWPALQAATILVAMVSGKNIWRLNFWRKSPIGNLSRLKEKLAWKIIKIRANLINSTSGITSHRITCLSHFQPRSQGLSSSRRETLVWAGHVSSRF